MALTKAHFRKHLSVEPLTEIEFAKSKHKLTKLLKNDDYLHKKHARNLLQTSSPFLKKTLKPVQLERHNHLHFHNNIPRSNVQNKLAEVPKETTESNDVAKIVKRKDEEFERKDFDNSSSLDVKRVKKVSFTIPNLGTSVPHFSHKEKTNHLLFTDKPVVFPSIPRYKDRLTKQGHTTPSSLNNLLYPISNDTNKGSSNDKQCNKTLCHDRLNGHLSEDSSYKRRSLAQKVQNRRGKDYLIKHKLPKLSEPSRKVEIPKQPSPNLVLIKARQILLQKMQSQSTQTTTRRRVIILPSLAAPCSEEFAVAMRRTYGNKFIPSPIIFDHVVQKHVPYQATAMLLDAIVRPPSTPSKYY